MKVAWIDLETTGINPVKNGIIQIGLIIDIDNIEKHKESIFVKPDDKLEMSNEALQISGITKEQIETYNDENIVYKKLKDIFLQYIDPYDKSDKFLFGGYNCRFDIEFLYNFWKRQNDNYFFSFFSNTLDVKEMLSFSVWNNKIEQPDNYKLTTIIKHLNLDIENAHDALSDIEVTKKAAYYIKEEIWKHQKK